MYNLSNELASPDFTLLLPTDDAVQKYLSRTNSSGLVGPDEKDPLIMLENKIKVKTKKMNQIM